jgi:hypothetical protein
MSEAILNTKGAAANLGCSVNWIHKLVYEGKIKARIYNDEGVLVEREIGSPRQGQGLYFYESDLAGYQPGVKRRPMGSKDKKTNNPKRKGSRKTGS